MLRLQAGHWTDMGAGNLNSVPQGCMASALSPETFPGLSTFIIKHQLAGIIVTYG